MQFTNGIRLHDSDHPLFETTDTFQQLVNHLNYWGDNVDSDLKMLDSAIGGVDSSQRRLAGITTIANNVVGGIVELDSDIGPRPHTTLNTEAKNLTDAINEIEFVFDASAHTIISAVDFTIDGEQDIILDADGGDIFLKDNGITFGVLNNTGGELTIKSNTTTAMTFNYENVEVFGTITMPASGSGSPVTTSKTVHGAIDETYARIPNVYDRNGTLLNP